MQTWNPFSMWVIMVIPVRTSLFPPTESLIVASYFTRCLDAHSQMLKKINMTNDLNK